MVNGGLVSGRRDDEVVDNVTAHALWQNPALQNPPLKVASEERLFLKGGRYGPGYRSLSVSHHVVWLMRCQLTVVMIAGVVAGKTTSNDEGEEQLR